MNNDISIVTAFFDIGRGNLPQTKHGRVLPHYQHRSVDTYFDFFSKQAKLQNEMTIYTTEDFAGRVYDIRKQYGLEKMTNIVAMKSYLPDDMKEVKEMLSKIFDRLDNKADK